MLLPAGRNRLFNQPRRYIGQVASRAMLPNVELGTSAVGAVMSRSHHRSAQYLDWIKVVLPNWYVGPAFTEITTSLTSTTFRAGIEYNGVFVPVTFNSGSSSGVCAAGNNLTSDWVKVDIPAFSSFFVRVLQDSAGFGTSTVCTANIADTARGDAIEVTTTDKTVSGTVVDAGAGYHYAPGAIVGYTSKQSFALIGDSGPWGQGDTYDDATSDWGLVARSLAGYGYSNYARQSRSASDFIASHDRTVALARLYHSYVIETHGAGDLVIGGASVATVQARLATIVSYFPKGRVITITNPPFTNSVNGWIAPNDQTNVAGNTNSSLLNTWKRTAPVGYARCYDVNGIVAVGDNWDVVGGPLTGDGLHANNTAQLRIRNSGIIRPQD